MSIPENVRRGCGFNRSPVSVVDVGGDTFERCQVCGKAIPDDKPAGTKNCGVNCSRRASYMRTRGLPVNTPWSDGRYKADSPHNKFSGVR